MQLQQFDKRRTLQFLISLNNRRPLECPRGTYLQVGTHKFGTASRIKRSVSAFSAADPIKNAPFEFEPVEFVYLEFC